MRNIFLLLSIFSVFTSRAQELGAVTGSFKRTGNTVNFTSANGFTRVTVLADGLLRITSRWDNRFEGEDPWMLVALPDSLVSFTVKRSADHFLIDTRAIQCRLFIHNSGIEIKDRQGKVLVSQRGMAGPSRNVDTIRNQFRMQPNENFFGFGERMDFLDQRSKKLTLNVGRGKGLPHIVGAYNILEANYSPVPFFMSTQGYGIFFHNAFATSWDMGATNGNAYSFSAPGGEMDYFFMYGPRFPSLLNYYTSITGRSPLLPIFALGLHVGTYAGGTWGYEQFTSDAYVVALARRFRELGIPIDILHLDSVWRIFGKKGGKGATSFEWRETFKDPAAMFDSLYAMNYNMVGMHLRPRFDNGNKLLLLDTAQKLGYTYPEKDGPGEFVNFFDQKAVDWWFEHGVKRLADQGARFLKTDEGSAFGALANESDKVGPTGREVEKLHNLFPLAYAKGAFEKFQQYNNMRGMNHTREGYAGIQRYPFIFAGDWPSEWQYFAPVIKAGLNIGMSGVSNWAHCMGGFEHVADPELYIRWCQFGLMSPIAHLFGMDHPAYKEPWNYGDTALRIFKKYDSLRYKLLPYLYSNAWLNHQQGMPLMRALVLNYQDDENVHSIADQYLLGESLMVCPVTTKGAQTRTVYLPQGDWYDYWTGREYSGRQYIHVVTPLDVLPMFVKAGGIIAMQPGMSYYGERPADSITLHIWPGASGQFNLYEDDGRSLEYLKKKYSVTRFKTSVNASMVKVEMAGPKGDFAAPDHVFDYKIHLGARPRSVSVNGVSGGKWNYDEASGVLSLSTSGKNSSELLIAL